MSTQEQQGRRVRVQRTIIGTPIEVQTALATAERQGRLVMVSPPRLHGPGTVRVSAVLVESAPAQPARVPARRPAERPVQPRAGKGPYNVARAARVAALVALAAAVAVATFAAIQWLADHAALIAALAVLAAVLAWRLRRTTGACLGLHCEGCGHR